MNKKKWPFSQRVYRTESMSSKVSVFPCINTNGGGGRTLRKSFRESLLEEGA